MATSKLVYKAIPTAFHDEKTHRRILAEASNLHNQGKFNCALSVTLVVSATSTTIKDNRITANSVLSFMPQTADAVTALAALYIPAATMVSGSAVIMHASSSAIDQTFNVGIFG